MENCAATRAFLLEHCRRYPELQLRDVFKALHQSTFGCGHLIDDPSAAAEYIRREADGCAECGGPLTEALDGDYCRVHLACLRHGVRAETLSHFLVLSAKATTGGETQLEQRLAVLLEMAAGGKLPFTAEQVRQEAAVWRAAGFSPLHHSQAFHKAYAPAYRVVRKEYGARLLP